MLADVAAVNPRAAIVRAESPVTLEPGPSLEGKRVLVVEDGPTLTHGGMTFGAGTVAARQGGAAELVDPRPVAVGSIAETLCPVSAARQRPPGDGLQRATAARAAKRRSTPPTATSSSPARRSTSDG